MGSQASLDVPTNSKSFLDDGFVFGLDGSGLERPKGKVASLVVEGDGTETTPYDGNYCIVSGLCNEALDKSGFFRLLEHAVYRINGVESNSWKLDPELRARTLNGEYQLPR